MPQQHRLKLPSASRDEQISGRDMWNRNRSESGAHFYTLGYTGRKLEELIARMLGAGVQTLLDIRQNPVSMYRPELSEEQPAQERRKSRDCLHP